MHLYPGTSQREINPITEITHSPLYPLVLLTIYLFGIGFTIGNYTGYFRFNYDVYGSDFIHAYLAFTVLGSASYFCLAGVAWLWAAKYVHTIDSRIRKLTFGFFAIFFLHDLPCFSMELHAIMTYGWRNGYQGFVFVIQIITFLISFTNGWLYYTWVMAGWLQYWYGYECESYGLKTGQEQLAVLPPMSPVEGGGVRYSNRGPLVGGGGGNNNYYSGSRRNSLANSNGNRDMIVGNIVGPSSPMLGSGLRWNGNGNGNNNNATMMNLPSPTQSGGSQQQQRRNSRPNTPTRTRQYEFDDQNDPQQQQQQQDNMLFSNQTKMMSAPNSGLRRSNPPGAFVFGNSGNNNNNNNQSSPSPSYPNNNFNFKEASQNNYRSSNAGVRPINVIEGLEDEQQQPQRSSSMYSNNNNNNLQLQPVSLVTSPQSNLGSRIRVSKAGNYVPTSPDSATRQGNSNFNNQEENNSNNNWRELPAISSGGGPNNNNIMWNNNRRTML